MGVDMPIKQAERAIGIFENQEQAVAGIEALLAAKIPPSQIVVVARDWHGHKLEGPRVDLQETAASGAVKGSALGGGLGVAAGVLVAMIPGVGLSVLILGALAAAAGAAVGCFVGPFVALEMSEADAKENAHHIEAGRIVVIVKTVDRRDEAQSLMIAHHAYDFSMTNRQ
jgi:hypothetical protein